ncbi:hypothetical protein COOONC_28535 [Cooperia oncophora]
MLLPLHATVRHISSRSHQGFHIVATGKAMVYLKLRSVTISLQGKAPIKLDPGHVITVSEKRNAVELTFKLEPTPGEALRDLVDNDRSYCSWQAGSSHYVRYLDDKEVYFLHDTEGA